jgi:hypothetical protein
MIYGFFTMDLSNEIPTMRNFLSNKHGMLPSGYVLTVGY